MLQPEQASPASAECIRAIAREGGNLGIEIVDVAGHVEGVAARVTTQAHEFHALRETALQVLSSDRTIVEAARSAGDVARATGEQVRAQHPVIQGAIADIRSLVETVQITAGRLQQLRTSLEEVALTAASIADIARHTHILAINATVEAAHAGTYGAGFAIIARDVRELANQARDTSQKVDASLKALAGLAGELAEASEQGRRKAESVGEGTRSIASLVDSVDHGAHEIERRASAIVGSAEDVEQRIGGFIHNLAELDQGVEASSSSLGAVSDRLNALMKLSERVLGLAADTGVDTIDRRYVDLAVSTARTIQELFEGEIASGRLPVAALFDEEYAPIPKTDPGQFVTSFTEFADRLLPPIQEPPLEQDQDIVFVVTVDRNGYLPTHNRKFSHPQRDDPEWNKANSRNRRMFDDRVGLAAARNTGPFLIQCYRRDMGGGRFALMKDASAPIFVSGRHWGALRVGYSA